MTKSTVGRPESQRQRRGHAFWPPPHELAKIPSLYKSEDRPIAGKVLWLHYFVGGCAWWVAEVDTATGEAFGYACLSDPQNAEWGYIDLCELESLGEWDGLLFPVERDRDWTPRSAREANLPGCWS